MITCSYDLHIHSCLSPCGDSDMTPANIVGMAALKGLDCIALTDHNSSRNCGAAMKLGEAYGVTVIPGMELTTAEEVHVLCLFEALEAALSFDSYVYEHLLPITNKPEIFGEQQLMDEDENILGTLDKLLISATDITMDALPPLVRSYGGVFIPAHVDKGTNSLISNLGFVPPDSSFSCFECKDMANLHQLRKSNPYLESCNVISDSDAHYLCDINEPYLTLEVEENSPKGILRALTLR